MDASKLKFDENRRQFLSKLIPAGMLTCMYCPKMFALSNTEIADTNDDQNELYKKRSEMSYEEIFNFAFRDFFIPLIKTLSEGYEKEEFLELLKEVASRTLSQKEVIDKSSTNLNQVFWKHVIEREVIEENDKVLELKITKCLWEKVYREANATDLGYALVCHTDFATAEAANQKLIRTKTLMQGDDCCNHRWIDKS
jgi:hypothetical protein